MKVRGHFRGGAGGTGRVHNRTRRAVSSQPCCSKTPPKECQRSAPPATLPGPRGLGPSARLEVEHVAAIEANCLKPVALLSHLPGGRQAGEHEIGTVGRVLTEEEAEGSGGGLAALPVGLCHRQLVEVGEQCCRGLPACHHGANFRAGPKYVRLMAEQGQQNLQDDQDDHDDLQELRAVDSRLV